MKQELLVVGKTGVEGASLDRLKLTNEVLLNEASRYPFHHKLSPLFGAWGFFSFFSFLEARWCCDGDGGKF